MSFPCTIDCCYDFHKWTVDGGGCAAALLTAACEDLCVPPLAGGSSEERPPVLGVFAHRSGPLRLLSELLWEQKVVLLPQTR